jgi:tRNA G18 (ribose-2'-O)-methylase SpoU
MYQPKDERNIGSLLRSAHLYDVDFTYQIGGTPYRYHATDTSRSTKSIPHHRYESLEDFCAGTYPLTVVAVELDTHSVPLSRFAHPQDAVYMLGSENRGIPRDVLDQIGRIVQVETANPWSLNVATAGAIVLHHRYTTINEGIHAA